MGKEAVIKSPQKNRPLSEKKITNPDDFDKSIIRRTIYDFHIHKKQLPTTKNLLANLKDSIGFIGS